MPHIIVEYTDNLKADGNIMSLLKKLNESLISEGDVFPIGGIRSRAIELTDYVVADGADQNDAFVHVILKIGSGRSKEIKKTVCDRLFQTIEQHFEQLFRTRSLALSMELYEFGEGGTYKRNNIHMRYKA